MPEGKVFNCPTCGSSLTAQGAQGEIKCPYCGNTVIVPAALRQPDPARGQTASPISIVMSDSGTSIQVNDLSAFQPPPVNVVLGDSGLAGQTNVVVSPTTGRWMKWGIWAFVAIMVLSVVLPLVCSFCGIFGGAAASILPFVMK